MREEEQKNEAKSGDAEKGTLSCKVPLFSEKSETQGVSHKRGYISTNLHAQAELGALLFPTLTCSQGTNKGSLSHVWTNQDAASRQVKLMIQRWKTDNSICGFSDTDGCEFETKFLFISSLCLLLPPKSTEFQIRDAGS